MAANNIIGFDFGTTNSVISVFHNGNLNEFIPPAYSTSAYIPSAVLYIGKECEIGFDALSGFNEMSEQEKSHFYRYFKMLLNTPKDKEYKARLDRFGWNSIRAPFEVTRDYLRRLLIDEKDDSSFERSKGKIQKIVITVPAVWEQNENNTGIFNLMKIVKEELHLPIVRLLSEPQAAAAFYLWRLYNELKEQFKGNILVCDMGGGTFDVSLVKASFKRIDVILNSGSGRLELGVAGVNFDKAVVKELLVLNQIEMDHTSSEFHELVRRFEDHKIRKFTKKPSSIRKFEDAVLSGDNSFDEPLFSIKCRDRELEVRAGLLSDIFQKEIQPSIESVLAEFDQTLRQEGESFDRIIIVGGFGRFILVQKAIYDYFKLRVDDSRIGDMGGVQNTYFAVAYGAALVAAGEVDVNERMPYDIGITMVDKYTGNDEDFLLIRKGEIIEGLIQPKDFMLPDESDYSVSIQRDENDPDTGKLQVRIRLFVNKGSQRHPFPKEVEFEGTDTSKEYKLRVNISKSREVFLILRNGSEQLKYSWSEIMNPDIDSGELVIVKPK